MNTLEFVRDKSRPSGFRPILPDAQKPAVSESVTSEERTNTLQGVGGGNGVGSP